jgi:uncharacterized protein YndB with AHSA1/START domain
MSVKVDASGRRSVQSEAEVPGTPEEVWQAIATGPGVSSWFVPCQIEERLGGKITLSFGPGMESTKEITAWNPPHRFSAGGSEMTPGGPTMATEWIVEARSGGTCLVKVVHSWFAETDEWDSQFEGTELGWAAFFRDLRVYLGHFSGQPCSTIQLMGFSTESQEATWSKLVKALGLAGMGLGDHVKSPSGSPQFAGEVKHIGPDDHPESLILLDRPAPGIAHLFAMPMGGMVGLSVRLFFYGDQAAETAGREEAAWQAWVGDNFPMPTPETA